MADTNTTIVPNGQYYTPGVLTNGSAPTVTAPTISLPQDTPTKPAPGFYGVDAGDKAGLPIPGYVSRLDDKTATDNMYAVKPIDEAAIRDQKLQEQQSRIDATNAQYDTKVNDEKKAGEKDMARVNTINAMMGLAGSPVATTGQGRSDTRTTANVANVNQQRALALSAIYDKIDQNVATEKQLELSTNKENSARLLDQMQKTASANIISHAAAGVDWNTAWTTSPDFQDEVKRSGADPVALKKEYDLAYASSKNNPNIDSYKTEIQDGNLIASWYDKSTGKPGYVVTPLNLPKGVDPKNVETGYDKDTGTVWYFDKSTLKGGSQKVGVGTGAGVGGTYVIGQNPTADAYVTNIKNGTSKLTDIKDNGMRNLVSQGLAVSGAGNKEQDDLVLQTKQAIDELLKTPGKEAAIGTNIPTPWSILTDPMDSFGKAGLPGSQSAGYLAQLERVKNIITLPNLKMLKGVGRITEREFNALSDSLTTLGNTNVTEDIHNKELQRIKDIFDAKAATINNGSSNASGQSSTVDSSDATGQPEGQTANNGTWIVKNGKWVANTK